MRDCKRITYYWHPTPEKKCYPIERELDTPALGLHYKREIKNKVRKKWER